MKTSLALSVLLFSMMTIMDTPSLLSCAQSEPWPEPAPEPDQPPPAPYVDPAVVDSDGKELKVEHPYYIKPTSILHGGPIMESTAWFLTDPCPYSVVLDPQIFSDGYKVRFKPKDTQETLVKESNDLNIVFDTYNPCFLSTGTFHPVWDFRTDPQFGRRMVKTGGEEGNPGPPTFFNWFKIVRAKVEGGRAFYKLVFCPRVCEYCEWFPCSTEIGVYVDFQGRRRLGLAEENVTTPFLFQFKDACPPFIWSPDCGWFGLKKTLLRSLF